MQLGSNQISPPSLFQLQLFVYKHHILVPETWISSYPGFGTEMRDSCREGYQVVKQMLHKQR